jgi:hypothetical protein
VAAADSPEEGTPTPELPVLAVADFAVAADGFDDPPPQAASSSPPAASARPILPRRFVGIALACTVELF